MGPGECRGETLSFVALARESYHHDAHMQGPSVRKTMRVLLALALVAVTFAGCASQTDPVTTTTTTGPTLPDSPRTFYHFPGAEPADPTRLSGNNTAFPAAGAYHSIGTKTFEPTIGVTAKGNLFIPSLKRISQGDSDNAAHVIRGSNNGTEWVDVGPFLGPTQVGRNVNSNDPYLYVDPWTNRIYDFDMCATLSGFCVSYSDDEGESWMTVSVATGYAPALDHQSLASAPAQAGVQTVGYPNVLVFCVNRGPNAAGSWCSTSRDGGINWTPLLPGFPTGTQQCAGLSGHVVGAGDGRFYRGMPGCGGPAVYRSDDAGITWSQHALPNATMRPGDHEVALAVDEANRVYAFWIGEDGLPYLAYSQDLAETWTAPMMVGAPGVTAAGFPSVEAGADGRVAFVYVGSTIEKGFSASQDKATWSGYIGVLTDVTAPMPLITTVIVNDPDEDPLSKGACGNVRCGGFGDFIDITIDSYGRPWAALAHNEHRVGLVGTLVEGPALKGPLQALQPIVLGGKDSIKA
jgi:hypothetical protein